MFGEEYGESLKQKQRAVAVSLSLLLHGLAVCGLLFAGLYQSADLEASFRNVVFIGNAMIVPPEPQVEKAIPRIVESQPSKPAKTETPPIMEPQAPAKPLLPAPPAFPENEPPPPLPMIPSATKDMLAQNNRELFVKPGTMVLPFGRTGNGASLGSGVTGISGASGSSTGGYGKPGYGNGERSSGSGGNGNGNGVERFVDADGGPFLVRLSPPIYPKFARRIGKEGKVLLSMLIDASGRLLDARVIEKAGYGFDESALDAVRLSLFKPALENGMPITCRARMAVRFQLKDAL